MVTHFRLTPCWHAPIIPCSPARVAPFGGAVSRSPMAAPAERTDRIEKIEKIDREDRTDKERAKAVEMAVADFQEKYGDDAVV